MQTFLPHPSFEESARALDYRRLGKQRVEAFQIMLALTNAAAGWRTHPASQQWRHNLKSLRRYFDAVVAEWVARGFKDNLSDQVKARWEHMQRNPLYDQLDGDPWWLGTEAYHRSHQANLVRKNPEIYSARFPGVEPADGYCWQRPVRRKRTLIVGESTSDFNGEALARITSLGFDLDEADAVNLLDGGPWDPRIARRHAVTVMREAVFQSGYNRVVLCGIRVTKAVGLPRGLLSTAEIFGSMLFVVPPPSGLNRWWHDPNNVTQAEETFAHGRAISESAFSKRAKAPDRRRRFSV